LRLDNLGALPCLPARPSTDHLSLQSRRIARLSDRFARVSLHPKNDFRHGWLLTLYTEWLHFCITLNTDEPTIRANQAFSLSEAFENSATIDVRE